MRILWVSHFVPYPVSGYGALQRSRALLLELCRRHEVILLAFERTLGFDYPGFIEEARDDLKKHCAHVITVPYPHWRKTGRTVRLTTVALLKGIPYSVAMYSNGAMKRSAARILRERRINLVHSDTLGLIDGLIPKLEIPAVLNHHNVESEMMKRRAGHQHRPLVRLLFRLEAAFLSHYERKVCRRYRMNLCVSELDRERLMACTEGIAVSVIENPVDCLFYEFNVHSAANQELIFAGSLDWYPNADAMIHFCESVWPLLKGQLPDLKLTIVGRNAPKTLEHLVREHQDVHLTGFVPDVRPLVKQASVYICPIRDGGGTRLKILDALAQGIPIVATSMAVEALELSDGKHVMIADRKEQYVEKIMTLFKNQELYQNISVSGRQYVEKKYSQKTIGRKLVALYNSL